MDAVLLKPVSITKQNLDQVIDADWVSREVVCRSLPGDAKVPACEATAN